MRDDLERGEAAYRLSDAQGDPGGAWRLGLLLGERGDMEGAEAAYRRADERGSAEGARRLGLLLAERGDREGAEAAYRRADERGSPEGTSNLGVLLKQRGDLDGAEAAFHRADERGDAEGAYRFGLLLAERGEMKGAEAAYQRADERGEPEGSRRLGLLRAKRGDPEGAEAAYRRAAERRDPADLGLLLELRGDLEGAEAAYRRADERGNAAGSSDLGWLLQQRGDLEAAEAAYRRADERGYSLGSANLGMLLRQRGDLEGAEAALHRADKRGNAVGSSDLGWLLQQLGDPEGAEAAYRRADERGYGLGSANLGALLQKRGDLEGAEAAYRRADERGNAAGSSNLGVLLKQRGDAEGAEAAYRRADERGDAAGSLNLGILLRQRGDLEGAEAAYRRADERGNAAGSSDLGWLLQERGDLEAAEAAYLRADERGYGLGSANLGVLLQQRGDPEAAEAAYRRADERGNGLGATNLGVLLAQRGDMEGAEAAYRRGDERGFALGTRNLGLMLARRGDHDGAVATWTSTDRRGFVDGAVQLGLALAREMNLQGRPLRAETIVRRITELEPRSGEAIRLLGTALALQGKDTEADEMFRRALELDGGVTHTQDEADTGSESQSLTAETTGHSDLVALEHSHSFGDWLRRIWNWISKVWLPQRNFKPVLSDDEVDAIRRLAEHLTYDFGLLIAGHHVPNFPLQSEKLERLRAQLEPFLATGHALRPDFGDYGRLTVMGPPDLKIVVSYTDFSCRETNEGGSFCPRPRHVELTFTALSPYQLASSFEVRVLHGRQPSAVLGTQPDSLKSRQEPPPPWTRKPPERLQSIFPQRCKGSPDCHRMPLGPSEYCLEHIERYALRDALAHHSGTIDARSMTIDRELLDTVIRSCPNLVFAGNVRFDYSSFVSPAHFDGCCFTSGASFEGAQFQQSGSFVGTAFAQPTEFSGCQFRERCSFDAARFYGAALFDSVQFRGSVSLAGATFHGGASFGRSHFLDSVDFTGCWFRRDVRNLYTMYLTGCVSFAGAVFETAPLFDAVRVSGTCVFDGALFNSADLVGLPIACEALSLVDAQFLGGVDLLLRKCEVILDGANFARSSRLTTAGVVTSRFGERKLRDRNSESLDRVRLVSLRGARVGDLKVDDVDLRACHFDGASGLDRMRIEGSESFAVGPASWLRTKRPVLAEEWEWRWYGHRGGPKVRASSDLIVTRPQAEGGKGWADIPSSCRRSPLLSETPGAIPRRKIVSIYRDLRKGREDNRDELNAADFYYSEMLMRSQRDHSSVLEPEPAPPFFDRVLLRIFWAVSGYDVRPTRSFAAFLVTVVGFAFAFLLWGYKQSPGLTGIGDAIVTCLAAATVFAPPDPQRFTLLGQFFEVLLRLLGPILLALTALGIRSRARR